MHITSARNNQITQLVKDHFDKNQVGYFRLYREPRIEAGIDGKSIRFYFPYVSSVYNNPLKRIVTNLNRRLKKFNAKAVIHESAIQIYPANYELA